MNTFLNMDGPFGWSLTVQSMRLRCTHLANRRSGQSQAAILQRRAQRKLAILDAAENVQDLRIPPANRLEKLRGDREGQYSIRINDQWRICFTWLEGYAENVEIADYH